MDLIELFSAEIFVMSSNPFSVEFGRFVMSLLPIFNSISFNAGICWSSLPNPDGTLFKLMFEQSMKIDELSLEFKQLHSDGQILAVSFVGSTGQMMPLTCFRLCSFDWIDLSVIIVVTGRLSLSSTRSPHTILSRWNRFMCGRIPSRKSQSNSYGFLSNVKSIKFKFLNMSLNVLVDNIFSSFPWKTRYSNSIWLLKIFSGNIVELLWLRFKFSKLIWFSNIFSGNVFRLFWLKNNSNKLVWCLNIFSDNVVKPFPQRPNVCKLIFLKLSPNFCVANDYVLFPY